MYIFIQVKFRAGFYFSFCTFTLCCFYFYLSEGSEYTFQVIEKFLVWHIRKCPVAVIFELFRTWAAFICA